VNRILVVDDEAAIRDAVSYALRSEGFEVEVASDGEAALEAALGAQHDVVVLDLMLPGMSGMEACRRIRAESAVPIIMLTARGAELDRVLGLEVGADDYVTKPFSMAELIGRIRAILRRRELDRSGRTAKLQVGSLELDPMRHEARVDGHPTRLTPSEFKLVLLLAEQPLQPAGDHAAPVGQRLRRRPASLRHSHFEPAPEARARSRPSRANHHGQRRRVQARGSVSEPRQMFA
jgi:two-component system, OmpR family, response regulator RegX3